ncbi:MAG: hypothetical protein H6Q42_3162 [Deltaproteobacteria bacterium]|jgi:hypothetical protein|nr:hypothetical protein [Deltaproteobacteria bacterium]
MLFIVKIQNSQNLVKKKIRGNEPPGKFENAIAEGSDRKGCLFLVGIDKNCQTGRFAGHSDNFESSKCYLRKIRKNSRERNRERERKFSFQKSSEIPFGSISRGSLAAILADSMNAIIDIAGFPLQFFRRYVKIEPISSGYY